MILTKVMITNTLHMKKKKKKNVYSLKKVFLIYFINRIVKEKTAYSEVMS